MRNAERDLGGERVTRSFPINNCQVMALHTVASYAGLVTSIDQSVERVRTGIFENGDDCVRAAFTAAVSAFQRHNLTWPATIVLLRGGDGIEKQLSHVKDHELRSIELAMTNMGCLSKLCLVAVSNRILPLFDNPAMPPPMTVQYDFFLVPQSPLQATVTPSHYSVLFDNTGLGEQNIRDMVYSLCLDRTRDKPVPFACIRAEELVE